MDGKSTVEDAVLPMAALRDTRAGLWLRLFPSQLPVGGGGRSGGAIPGDRTRHRLARLDLLLLLCRDAVPGGPALRLGRAAPHRRILPAAGDGGQPPLRTGPDLWRGEAGPGHGRSGGLDGLHPHDEDPRPVVPGPRVRLHVRPDAGGGRRGNSGRHVAAEPVGHLHQLAMVLRHHCRGHAPARAGVVVDRARPPRRQGLALDRGDSTTTRADRPRAAARRSACWRRSDGARGEVLLAGGDLVLLRLRHLLRIRQSLGRTVPQPRVRPEQSRVPGPF